MDRPDRDEDGNWIYYASELGGCTKALIAKRMGKVQKESEAGTGSDPGYLPRIFSEGHLHEEAVVKLLDDSPGTSLVWGKQMEVKHHYGVPGTITIGHIDGLWQSQVIEIKSMGDSSFKVFKKQRWDTPGLVQKYKWQLSLYCFHLEMPGLLIVKNRNDGEIVMESMDAPFYNYDDIQLRLLEIESCAETGILPDKCDYPNFPCPFEYLHNEVKTIRTDAQVDMLVNTYLDAQREVRRHQDRAAAARSLLAEALGDTDRLETVGGSRVVKYGDKDKPSLRISTRQEQPSDIEDGI